MRHDGGLTMGSFRLKLVGYFLLLALIPLAGFFFGFRQVAERSETRLVDARMQAGLRASSAALQESIASAAQPATELAGNVAFVQAVTSENRLTITKVLRDEPNLRVLGPGGFRVGSEPTLAIEHEVPVIGPGGLVGWVVASVRLDSALAVRLRDRSGLAEQDAIAILDHGRVVAGAPDVPAGSVRAPAGVARGFTLGGTRYRVVVGNGVQERPGVALAVVTPQALIDGANHARERELLLAVLLSLLLIGIVAFLQGRSIVRTVQGLVLSANELARGNLKSRVEVRGRDELAVLGRSFNTMADELENRLEELEAERARLREAFSRLGAALAATHDSTQLMRVVVETVADATGADGAVLLGRSGVVVETGDPAAGDDTFELPLAASGTQSFGTLVLYGPGFDEESRETARTLAAQAAVALENARLHGVVERQALVDGLTGLANRRQLEEELEAELARAERLGGSTALVFADLDDFKAVNDRHGHPAGDAVLCAFAELLRESVREIDTAARFGGEEFTLLLPGTDAAGAANAAERVRVALAERVIVTPGGAAIRITASFGVATSPPSQSVEELIAAADTALYVAKHAGKNRVEAAQLPLAHP
jgi:diguanylate cyclase (GGDEF)-like protein